MRESGQFDAWVNPTYMAMCKCTTLCMGGLHYGMAPRHGNPLAWHSGMAPWHGTLGAAFVVCGCTRLGMVAKLIF